MMGSNFVGRRQLFSGKLFFGLKQVIFHNLERKFTVVIFDGFKTFLCSQ